MALLAEAKSEGVTFVAGPDFMIDGGANSLRLSFAPVPADRADEGVARIASALDDSLRSPSQAVQGRRERRVLRTQATEDAEMRRFGDLSGR